jgi:hypothetical protein
MCGVCWYQTQRALVPRTWIYLCGQMGNESDRQTDRQTDRQADTQAERQREGSKKRERREREVRERERERERMRQQLLASRVMWTSPCVRLTHSAYIVTHIYTYI